MTLVSAIYLMVGIAFGLALRPYIERWRALRARHAYYRSIGYRKR